MGHPKLSAKFPINGASYFCLFFNLRPKNLRSKTFPYDVPSKFTVHRHINWSGLMFSIDILLFLINMDNDCMIMVCFSTHSHIYRFSQSLYNNVFKADLLADFGATKN